MIKLVERERDVGNFLVGLVWGFMGLDGVGMGLFGGLGWFCWE